MKEEWDYKILDEMGSISRGRSKHRPRNDPSLFGGKYPFIQTAEVKAAEKEISESVSKRLISLSLFGNKLKS